MTKQIDKRKEDLSALAIRAIAALGCAVAALSAQASPLDLKFNSEILPEAYESLVQPFVNSTRFSFVHPAASTGTLGFEIGVGLTGAELPKEAKVAASNHVEDGADLPEMVAFPKIIAMKGLPYGLDLGVNLAMVPSTDIFIAGGAIQWAFLDMSFPVPVMSLRVGHTQIIGIDTLKAQSTNAEIVTSLGIPPGVNIISPYAGLGIAWNAAESDYEFSNPLNNGTETAKADSSWQEIYGLVGLKISVMPFIGITAELQASENQNLYSAKLSFSF